MADTGAKVINPRWVCDKKGEDGVRPIVGSQQVASDKREDVFEGTPGLRVINQDVSHAATRPSSSSSTSS